MDIFHLGPVPCYWTLNEVKEKNRKSLSIELQNAKNM